MKDRWQVKITYIDNSYDFFSILELAALQDIVEKGPHWATIKSIEIIYKGGATIGAMTEEIRDAQPNCPF